MKRRLTLGSFKFSLLSLKIPWQSLLPPPSHLPFPHTPVTQLGGFESAGSRSQQLHVCLCRASPNYLPEECCRCQTETDEGCRGGGEHSKMQSGWEERQDVGDDRKRESHENKESEGADQVETQGRVSHEMFWITPPTEQLHRQHHKTFFLSGLYR